MLTKRFIIATVFTIALVPVIEFLIHGTGLKGLYAATASVWRPEESMATFILDDGWGVVCHTILCTLHVH